MFLTELSPLKGTYASEYDWKDIHQALATGYLADTSKLSTPFMEHTSRNGIKQLLLQAFAKVRVWNRTIGQWKYFNPDKLDKEQLFLKYDHEIVGDIEIPREEVTTFSASQGVFNAWKQEVIDRLYGAFDIHMFGKEMNAILTQKYQGRDKDGVMKTVAFTLDRDEIIGAFNTDTLIKSGLEKMRAILAEFKTPSKNWTAFAKEDKSKEYTQTFFPSDFILLFNTDFKSKIPNVLAETFHKDDLVLGLPTQMDYKFSEIDGLDNNEKTQANRTVAYLIHKSALNTISPSNYLTEDGSNNFKRVIRVLKMYGFGRFKPFPIIRFKTQ